MKIVFPTDDYWPRINGVIVSIRSNKSQLERIGQEIHVLTPTSLRRIAIRESEEQVHLFSSNKILFSPYEVGRLVYPRRKRKQCTV
jgi:hypothetical protein